MTSRIVALDTSRHTSELARHPHPIGMTPAPSRRSSRTPGALVLALVALGTAAAVAAGALAIGSGRATLGSGVEVLALVAVGALTRRYGIGLPGNGFTSYLRSEERRVGKECISEWYTYH